MEELEEAIKYTLGRLEGFMKFKNISKAELARKWGKTEAYVYRRFSGDVELSLTDILELTEILNIPKEEAKEIFFGYELRNA